MPESRSQVPRRRETHERETGSYGRCHLVLAARRLMNSGCLAAAVGCMCRRQALGAMPSKGKSATSIPRT